MRFRFERMTTQCRGDVACNKLLLPFVGNFLCHVKRRWREQNAALESSRHVITTYTNPSWTLRDVPYAQAIAARLGLVETLRGLRNVASAR